MGVFVYRVRPINSHTLDELSNLYLWFSRPCGFKGDINDANIGAFVEDTEAIKKGIISICPNFDFDKWYEQMGYIGICCFTTELPTSDELRHFPNCGNGRGICIEYDTAKLEDFFAKDSKIPIPPIFHDVIYDNEPTKLDTCGDWSILWEKGKDYNKYKTIKNIFKYSDSRVADTFIIKLLTRINSKFSNQKETRLIMGGCLLQNYSRDVLGYKISIPDNTINRVIVYSKVGGKWIDELKKIEYLRNKIELSNK